jgi:formiminoglutamase
LPDDLGVRLNQGRPGAAEGPGAFRAALAGYGVAEPCDGLTGSCAIFDAGDIAPAPGTTPQALMETHRRVRAASRALCSMGLFPIAIGGGHDLTYPFVAGVIDATGPEPFVGVYFDAHLDVRETLGSGMPFRRLIEDCGVRQLHVEGLNPFANTREHHAWFHAHGGRTEPLTHSDAQHLFCSIDLDVLDASHAPGVSAMHPAGWSVRELAARVDAIAADPKLRCMDIMELSPPHDVGDRTARVAAQIFLVAVRRISDRLTATGTPTKGATP